MAGLILFVGCWLGGYLFPWWWPALAACAVGAWLPRRSASAAWSGFLGAGLAWAAAAAWQDLRNHHILSARIAALFHLPGPAGAVAATGAVGGLMGALGAWAGYAVREWLRPRPQAVEPPPFADARKAAAEAAGSESSGGSGLPRAPESAAQTAPAADGAAPITEAGEALPGLTPDGLSPAGEPPDAPLAKAEATPPGATPDGMAPAGDPPDAEAPDRGPGP
jgi:hypothetical protein